MTEVEPLRGTETDSLHLARLRRASLRWKLAAPVRRAEHVLRRVKADSRLRSMPRPALRLIMPAVTVLGDPDVLKHTSRVAIIASYSATSGVSRSLVALVHEFAACGYTVVLVRASDSTEEIRWPDEATPAPLLINKPNVGYDFGSWATALALFPDIASIERVVLANDSLLGPFTSLAGMIDDFESSPSDVWGATDTVEYLPHLQSYLLGFRGGVLDHPAVRSFWRSVRVIPDKDAIVVRYEIGLSRLLATEGFISRSWFDHRDIVPEGGNPTTIGGSRLLAAGFPFVKRILIENSDIFPDAAVASEFVRTRYAQNVEDWI